ncbi:hypothetical protein X975_00555, partial [Stegodyphus mimosarum]
MVTPVLGGARKKRRRILDIETRKPANFTLTKTRQDADESGSAFLQSMVSPSIGYTLKQNENLELERLPSPEEQAMLVALEYPSVVVPVDTSGTSFTRMSLLRRSLIHADFVIKRKKSKKRSKRRHTFCEGDNREIEKAIRNVTNSSCQTDDLLDITSMSSTNSMHRSLSKRRSRSVLDNSRRRTSILDELDLVSLKQDSKDSATEDDKDKSPSKGSIGSMKKSKTSSSLRSRAFNPISSLSAAISIAAVKMRNSTRSGGANKQDDGRSSSGNWSASSSTRASVDSDHHHAASPVDGVSSPSRNSIGKDSVLSDATQLDPHNRSRDDEILIHSLTSSPVKRKKYATVNLPWEPSNGSTSNTPTPDLTSHCSSSTPIVRSPYTGRRGVSDDGDSSVYSVDTDGYYTSMHTDSGLWCNAMPNLKSEDVTAETVGYRQRQESQSSVSTIGNSSINSFLSKSATECSSNSGSLKRQVCPQPPPRVSSCKPLETDKIEVLLKEQDLEDSDKSYSPHPQNGSTSESEHEVRDRIREKTAITPHRYPSMCAVSPETSDDEIADLKNRTLTSNINIIVAEVHNEEKVTDNVCEGNEMKTVTENKTDEENKAHNQNVPSSTSHSNHLNSFNLSPSINMYRSETPVPSHFLNTVSQSHPVCTSTPRSDINISTFSPDVSDTGLANTKSENSNKNLHSDFRSDFSSDIIVTENPSLVPNADDKCLIPLKYAQRITVTPIARSDSSNSCTGTIKRTPLKQSVSSTSGISGIPKTEKSASVSSKNDTSPTYISFQSPDSPVSSVTNFIRVTNTENNASSPTNSLSRGTSNPTSSLPRPGARVASSPTSSLPRNIPRVTSNPTSSLARNVPRVASSPTSSLTRNVPRVASSPTSSLTRNAPRVASSPTSSLTRNVPETASSPTSSLTRSIPKVTSSSVSSRIASKLISSPTSSLSRPVARVTLDPTGNVVYSSNSLERAGNSNADKNNREQRPYATLPMYQAPNAGSKPPTEEMNRYNISKADTVNFTRTNLSRVSTPHTSTQERTDANSSRYISPGLQQHNPTQSFSSFKCGASNRDFNFRPSRGGRFCRSYFPSHLISSPTPETQGLNQNTFKNISSVDSLSSPSRDSLHSAGQNQSNANSQNFVVQKELSSNTAILSNPVPKCQNDSFPTPSRGYGSTNTEIWPGRIHSSSNQHSFSTSKIRPPSTQSSTFSYPKKSGSTSTFVSLSPPDVIPSSESPPSTLDITLPANTQKKFPHLSSHDSDNVRKPSNQSILLGTEQKNLKSMSANELFAIIHNSKKKHNIKTESDISLSPLSSRSVSPALSQSSVSKLQPVETGVLFKRSENCPSPSDRTKWCNSMPSTPGKKWMPVEKLGPTKPTSMHDFKMLLLQARTGSQETNPRPSAAELLKVSPPKSSPNFRSSGSKLPVPSSSLKSTVPHFSSNINYSPGHGTVPLKRNMRTRSPYLSRYDSAYPPIMEDCLEELESYEENKCLVSNPQSNRPQIFKNSDSLSRSSTPAAKATSTWV